MQKVPKNDEKHDFWPFLTLLGRFWPFWWRHRPKSMSGWKSAPNEVLIEWSHGYLPMKKKIRCMSSRGLYDPYDVIGGDFWVKNIKYFIFILFLAPKKIFEKLARAENFDPIFDPPSLRNGNFWGVDPMTQSWPGDNPGSVQSFIKIVRAVFDRTTLPPFWHKL